MKDPQRERRKENRESQQGLISARVSKGLTWVFPHISPKPDDGPRTLACCTYAPSILYQVA